VIVVVLLLAATAAALFWPLRARREPRLGEERAQALAMARDSKLAEINDLELDFRLGKLSVEDYRATNVELRAEAVEIIRRLETSAANGRQTRSRNRRR
jgi:hypothetical protein